MEFFRDKNKWSFALFGLLVAAVLAVGFYLSGFTKAVLKQEDIIGLYAGLCVVLVSGGLALLVSWRSRKEVMIYQEKGGKGFSNAASLLTVSPSVINSGISKSNNHIPDRNGHVQRLTTIYSEDRSIR